MTSGRKGHIKAEMARIPPQPVGTRVGQQHQKLDWRLQEGSSHCSGGDSSANILNLDFRRCEVTHCHGTGLCVGMDPSGPRLFSYDIKRVCGGGFHQAPV